MKTADILALVNAGFTKDEILALTGKKPPERRTPTTEENEPAPQPEPAPSPQPGQAVDFAALLREMQNISTMLAKSNIVGTPQPAEESTGNIIAALIGGEYLGA